MLEIKSVPISIEYTVNNARLEVSNDSVDLEISQNKGGDVVMRSRPVHLNIDKAAINMSAYRNRQANPVVTDPTPLQNNQYYSNGTHNSSVTTGGTAVQSNYEHPALSVNIVGSSNEVLAQANYIPEYPDNMDLSNMDISINYDMDKVISEFRFHNNKLEFIPADIEITIKEMPDVQIKYIGGPIYVPPSADPNAQ
jgi:hypothetical protein